jgi:two-component system, NtrC family, sensor kinase
MKLINLIFLYLILCTLGLGRLASQDVLQIQDGFSKIKIDPYIEFSIEEKGTPLTIEQAKELKFNKLEGENSNLGYQNTAYWFRLNLEDNRSNPSDLVFVLNYPLLESVDFYILEGDTFQKIETGSARDLKSRSLEHRLINIKISVSYISKKILYYRIQTRTSLQGGGVLKNLEEFYESKVSDTLYLGIYYSGILVLILYNIFIFFFLREKVYFFYFMQQIMYVLIQMSLNGTFFYWISERVPGLDLVIIVPAIIFLLFFIIEFAVTFLAITIKDKFVYNMFYYIKRFLIILLTASFFIPYKYGIIGSILLIILVLFILLFTALQKVIEKYKPAKYYLLANLLLILGAIIYAFKSLGLLPANLFTEYTFQIGSLSQAILLSLGLAYRIDLMRIENKNLNTNLELQIKETNILYKNLQNEIIEKAFLQKSNDEIQLEYSETKVNLEKAKEKSKSLQEIMLQSEKKLETVKKELEEAFFQLIQAEKLSTIGTMVAGIAHDINNPLNFMSGANFNLSKTLKDFKDTLFGMVGENTDEDSIQAKNEFQTRFEKFQKFIDDINLGINRITEISKSMRNATRTDKELSKDVSFSEVCEEAIIITSSKLKNVELIREFSSDFPYLTCNRSQMSQVIMNFLSNSADAIEEYKINHPEYKGKIKIFLRRSPEKISFGVEDNGGGIMKEAREKVMKAFYTTKPTGVGTGLGLAICGKIIESHGWKISIDNGIENKNGYGAKFEVICSEN